MIKQYNFILKEKNAIVKNMLAAHKGGQVTRDAALGWAKKTFKDPNQFNLAQASLEKYFAGKGAAKTISQTRGNVKQLIKGETGPVVKDIKNMANGEIQNAIGTAKKTAKPFKQQMNQTYYRQGSNMDNMINSKADIKAKALEPGKTYDDRLIAQSKIKNLYQQRKNELQTQMQQRQQRLQQQAQQARQQSEWKQKMEAGRKQYDRRQKMKNIGSTAWKGTKKVVGGTAATVAGVGALGAGGLYAATSD